MLQQSDSSGDKTVPDIIPSTEFEKTRRLLGNDIQETMFYFQAQLEDLKKKLGEGSPLATQVEQILDEGIDRIRVSQHDLRILSDLDGLNLWREKEAVELSELIQKRLHKLQNPPDCSKARKLICNLNKGCGYGCQIHHAVYCFIVAYGAKRTLILRSKNWRYDKNGWEDVFQPLSETCTDTAASSFSHWPGAENTQAVELPIVDTLSHRPPILPPAIPKDISERLIRFHGNPTVWWVGQFLKYMLRFQPKTQAMIDSMKESMGFKTPVVGIHIRRTDKVGTEAAFHSVEEYMERAEEYYKLVSLSNPNVVRRVYIASDDPKVITEARNKFPNYTIYGDPNVSKTAAVSTRYTDASLRGIIADIYFLSLSDYLVCTFSSQVCRLAYEILQTFHPDGADRFRSLDDIYYYGGQNPHNQRARFPHTAKRSNEMSLKVGDFVGVAGNHWDGFSKGFNRRSKQTGLYPSYKAEETVEVANIASYADFDKNET
ncbi:Alpha-(1,6)-fucosyltransferase [Armadillidium nasatum]|uniref:Alpha-(1,6)-fucosyltransferase n=1 Tax=Armadillidium nasatum TaxID=96803 RepID=A0A5N5SJM5_9CRUS|nr:Alpha-(1,6)-fucosyltransferase [Armadillidium nasatum]